MVEMHRNALQVLKHATTRVKTDLKDGDVFQKLQSALNLLKNNTVKP